MQRSGWIQFGAIVFAGLCFAVAGRLSLSMSAVAGRAQLTYADTVEKGDPPEVAVGIAMGSFRGVFVNLLWLRAERMKEDGRFYEAVELSRAITRLQPRLPQVWVYHAWNMAYNISVATHTADERWRWVRAGIELLRDEAIPRNPSDAVLYKNIAWIYNHKIQGVTDDANHFYKRRVAEEWTAIMGSGPGRLLARRKGDEGYERFERILGELREERRAEALEQSTDGEPEIRITRQMVQARAAAQDRAAALERIDETPDDLEQLVAQTPEVGALVQAIDQRLGLEPGFVLLRRYELFVAAVGSVRRSKRILEGTGRPFALRGAAADPDVHALAILRTGADGNSPEFSDQAWDALLAYSRKIAIRKRGMDPARMARYTRLYGPLDWRHPSSHSLYWASIGYERGSNRINSDDFMLINNDRVILHSVQELFRWGNIYYDILDADTGSEMYIALSNYDFVDTYLRAMEDIFKREPDRTTETWNTFRMGYVNYLEDLVRTYYRRGDKEEAERMFERVRNFPHHNLGDHRAREAKYGTTIEEFIRIELQERFSDPQVAAQLVSDSIMDCIYKGLMERDQEVAKNALAYARRAHAAYFREQGQSTIVDTTNRMDFMPRRFTDAVANALVAAVLGGGFDEERMALLWREAINFMPEPAAVAHPVLRARMEPELGPELFAVFFPAPGVQARQARQTQTQERKSRQQTDQD